MMVLQRKQLLLKRRDGRNRSRSYFCLITLAAVTMCTHPLLQVPMVAAEEEGQAALHAKVRRMIKDEEKKGKMQLATGMASGLLAGKKSAEVLPTPVEEDVAAFAAKLGRYIAIRQEGTDNALRRGSKDL